MLTQQLVNPEQASSAISSTSLIGKGTLQNPNFAAQQDTIVKFPITVVYTTNQSISNLGQDANVQALAEYCGQTLFPGLPVAKDAGNLVFSYVIRFDSPY
jgi:hypothetical protein